MIVENWIFEKNIFSFIKIVTNLFSYCLDDEDIKAIKYNYKNTDYANNNWFKYEINKKMLIKLFFALEENSTHIFIRIQLENIANNTINKIQFLFDICQYYFIKDENLNTWYEEL